MAKTYEKDGDSLKEVFTKTEVLERKIELKGLRNHLKFLNDEIDRIKSEKLEIQALIDKCIELNIKEKNEG